MPRLPIEPYVFPDSLLSSDESPPDDNSRWWVMHTRPRQEKSLARELCLAGVRFYLPVISKRVRVNGRVAKSCLPLFPGYVAVRGNEQDLAATLETRRVVNVLDVMFQEEFQTDMHRLHRLIESGRPLTREDRLAAGDRVVIRKGPLAGLEGDVLRCAAGHRFLVQVNFIQRGASVLVDDFELDFID